MKVLLAGASGALGRPISRLLVEAGHEVIGLTREPANGKLLRSLGVIPLVADALDRDGLLHAVRDISADAVINQLTSLKKPPLRHSGMSMTNRLRTEGSANLRAAAEVTGARRFVTQSMIFGYGYRNHGESLLTETAPFGEPAGTRFDTHLAAMRVAEEQAFGAPEGIALRYGLLYGGDAEQLRPLLVNRWLPVVDGGVLGWIHHEDAAAATVAAVERGQGGAAYNIVDDRPATWREVFDTMAEAFHAPKPLAPPSWLMRLIAPYVTAVVLDTSMRVSNAKAKRELGWRPLFPSYIDGIAGIRGSSPQTGPAAPARGR